MVTYYEALSIMKGIRFQTLFAGALIRTIKKRLKDLMILSSMKLLSPTNTSIRSTSVEEYGSG